MSGGADPAKRRFRLELGTFEWTLLKALPERLRGILLDPLESPKVLDRLFPPAFKDDPEASEEHRALIGRTLFDERLEALKAFEATLEGVAEPNEDGEAAGRHLVTLGEPELDLWLHILNDMRLLLATELDIDSSEWFQEGPRSEDQQGPYQMLSVLSALQELLLRAARSA